MNTNHEYESLAEIFNEGHVCPLCHKPLEFGEASQTEEALISTFPNIRPHWRGVSMVGLTIKCNQCLGYSMTLNVRCKRKKDGDRIESVAVNSEEVSIEVDDVLYEIRNVYGTNKTEYSSFVGKEDKVQSAFPLITDNLDNPYALLAKIQKLIAFS